MTLGQMSEIGFMLLMPWFLRYLAHHSVRLFVIYRVLLGSAVLLLVAFGAIE